MYELNQQAARQGDERGGRIDTIGEYVGVFKRAEHVIATKKGTTGVEFAFETNDRMSAQFSLWTLQKDGKEIFGFKQLQAIMTVLRCRSLVPSQMMVKKYDRNSKGMIDVSAECFADLMNKPIGVLFETEEYEKLENGIPTGDIGVKIVFAGCFDSKTRLTASEILDKKVQPLKLEQNIRTLKHRALRRVASGGAASNSGHPNAPGNSYGGGSGDFDDDVPF